MDSPTIARPQRPTYPAAASSVAAAFSARFRLDLRSLAAFRIALGVILIADGLLRCRDFSLMFTPEGMFPHEALHTFTPSAANWSLCFLIDAAWWDGLILGLEGSAGLALVAGFQTRLATLVAWIAVVSVVRRTAPATNAGDLWLATLLLWGVFLPLGSRWSVDAIRRPQPLSSQHASAASLALTLQILVVYLAAGLSKCNASWFSGRAVRDALSVHDHGTALGAWLVQFPGMAEVSGALVLTLELLGPVVFLLFPRPQVRLALVLCFLGFHCMVALLMSVGLFAPIGIAAWLSLIPGPCWDRLVQMAGQYTAVRAWLAPLPASTRAAATSSWRRSGVHRVSSVCASLLLGLAAADAAIRLSRLPTQLPAAAQAAVDLSCLRQDWEMFGTVPHQSQWVYARGLLVDGSEVDLLRHGQPLQRERPTGGFTTLPHHRWHKLLWVLPKPPMRVFSPGIAHALATHWNRNHPPDRKVRQLEICFTRLTANDVPDTAEPGIRHELVIATWPPRNSTGAGNLDRWLEAHGE
jgi:uncharacterized membrane protein YphA (DoxX/SURF4 family)